MHCVNNIVLLGKFSFSFSNESRQQGNVCFFFYLNINQLDALNFIMSLFHACGPGSSVGIATDYGLDGPGSNPGGDEIFCPCRPVLGPTQPPVQWVPGLSRG